MAVFTEADGTQALYVAGNKRLPSSTPSLLITLRAIRIHGLLRTTDGINFAPIPMDPGTFMGKATSWRIRRPNSKCEASAIWSCTDGVMYATATDYIGTGSIISSSNPSAGDNAWQAVSPPTATMPVRTLLVFNNYLYVGGGDARGSDRRKPRWKSGPSGRLLCL